jgi:hypothetical protein
MIQAGVPVNLQWGANNSFTPPEVEPNPMVTESHSKLNLILSCTTIMVKFFFKIK